MKPLHYRSVSSKGAGRPLLTHHHEGWWNETKWMRWVWRNGGMKFVRGENGRNPAKNLPRPRFVHHETHMEGPRRELGTPAVGVERLTACATRSPHFLLILVISKYTIWVTRLQDLNGSPCFIYNVKVWVVFYSSQLYEFNVWYCLFIPLTEPCRAMTYHVNG